MVTARIPKLPAICILGTVIIILCTWKLISADESKGKKLTYSDIFSSLPSSSNDGSKPHDQSAIISKSQLNALLEQINPQQKQQGGQTRNNHGHSRRKLLYDLSLKAHYGKLVRQKDAKHSSVVHETEEEVTSCVYFNEGISSVQLKDVNVRDETIFRKLSYWSFKICPRQSIKQVRLVPVIATSEHDHKALDGTEPPIKGDFQLIKLPSDSIYSKDISFLRTSTVDAGTYEYDNSLSTEEYHFRVKTLWGPNEQDMLESSTEYFFHGDQCQYHKAGVRNVQTKMRTSKIVYDEKCCEREEMAAGQIFQQSNDFTILSVTEPEICQYAIRICRFCRDLNDNYEDKEQEEHTQQSSSDDIHLSSVDPSDFMHLMQTYLHHMPESESTAESDHYNPPGAFPPMPQSQIEANKQLLRSMFTHAYDSYMYNAFPASELKPITCTAGTFNLVRIPALTLIDTLDTLVLMRNFTEFARSVERIRYLDEKMRRDYKRHRKDREDEKGGLFSVDQNVSLFETTIRVLGGLLSAHQLALAFMDSVVPKSQVWDSSGDILWGYDTDNESASAGGDATKKQHILLDERLLSLSHKMPCIPRKESNEEPILHDNSEDCWIYDGLFLTLAHDIGKRLAHAFDTLTGIPFGTVNLLRGVPLGETEIASLAGAGTLTLEFELLSRLTGDPTFGKAAMRSTRSLWLKRTRGLDLFGKHINVRTGSWTESLSGIGSNSDSFYEYLVKHYILFPDDDDFWIMFCAAYAGVWQNSRIGDWYVDVDMNRGLQGAVKQTFESLMAFYPGMQVLLGELPAATKTLNSFFLVREFLGLLPERFDFVHWRVEGSGGDVHPLRPELVESAYFLHLATVGLYGPNNGPQCSDSSASRRVSSWLWAADFALHAVARVAWISCGFATVNKVSHLTTGNIDFVNGFSNDPHDWQEEQTKLKINHHNEMPSFFLSETIKYLYLLFDSEDGILHQDTSREWVFTTEAHPIHHVPKWSANLTDADSIEHEVGVRKDESNLDVQMAKIRLMLKQQIESSSNKTNETEDCMIEGSCPVKSSSGNLPQILVDELEIARNTTILRKNSTFELFGLKKGPTFHIELPQDDVKTYGIYSSEVSSPNYAHHHLYRMSSGNNIGRKCPNFHHPRLAWPLALHGQTVEYNINHKTTSSDVEDKLKVDPRMQTALASTLYYGTDYYSDGISVDSNKVCSTRNGQSESTTNDPNKDGKENTPPHTVIPGAVRYDMGGSLGLFDVSAFNTGDGFVVRHVASGELLEVSMFKDSLVTSGSIVILVSLSTPAKTKISDFVSTKHGNQVSRLSNLMKSDNPKTSSKEIDTDDHKDHTRSAIIDYDLPEKQVVVADMNGHSYFCEVVIKEKDETLARLPCSPGFFGKAHIENLIQNDGISVTGPLQTPPSHDSVGCESPEHDSPINANNFCLHSDSLSSIVQIVYRGKCNFTEKTLNQHILSKAAAVIVINTIPVELFCMAGDKEISMSPDGCSQMDFPPSVLVTGHDGDWLLDLFEWEKQDLSAITATVSISKQSEEEIVQFPYVKGSENTVQVFASNGWGAQAVRQNEEDNSNDDNINTGWQLFITAHNLNPNQ